MIHERERRYKSIDKDGDIYLIANPSAWKDSTDADRRTSRWRPEPKLIFTATQATAEKKDTKLIDYSTGLEPQSGGVKW